MYDQLSSEINENLHKIYLSKRIRIPIAELKEFLAGRDLVTIFTDPSGGAFVFPVDIDKLEAKWPNSHLYVIEPGLFQKDCVLVGVDPSLK